MINRRVRASLIVSGLTIVAFFFLSQSQVSSQGIGGTAWGLSGPSLLPNGTTATTQTALDNSTKLATTAYTDAAVAAGGSMVYPGAGVANSTGSAWGTSYTVGTGASNLVQLTSGSALPAVSAANLTSFPTLNQNTSGTASNVSGTPALPNGTTATTQTTGDGTTKLATDAFVIANAGTGSPPVTTVAAGPLTATQSITTLCASATCTTGTYRVDWVFWGSGTACSSVTAGQVTLALTWTDKQGTAHSGLLMLMLTQTSATGMASQANFHFETSLANEGSSGVYVLNTNGAANIQYTMTYTACTTGTGTYNFTAAVTRLQ